MDRRTGHEIWAFHPNGETMPTPLYDNNALYAGAGDGYIYKLNTENGKLIWKSDIISFVSMSSPVKSNDSIFFGGTNPNFFYSIDMKTGKINWKTTYPGIISTGMGDCTPAYEAGIVVQEITIKSGDASKPVANVLLALDAKSGNVIWTKRFAKGQIPPAMKTATPVISDGVVYEGSPVSGDYSAIDLKSGKELWSIHLGSQIRAGAAIQNGIAYIPYSSGNIAVIRIKDGKLLNKIHIGGTFGPSSPVIIGGTLYTSNIFGWVMAMPVSKLLHHPKSPGTTND